MMTFPRELERHFFRDLDKTFITIWLITLVVGYSLIFYLSSLPPKQLSQEEVKKFIETIYRVKPAVVQRVERKAEKKVTVAEEVQKEAEEVREEVRPVTEEAKAERIEQQRAARRERQEQRRQAIAERVKILAAPTARGGVRRAGAATGGRAIGLTEGGEGKIDLKQTIGIVGDVGVAEKVKKLRGGGAVTTDIGDIDIAELKTLSAEDLSLMLKEAPLEVNRAAITARGSATKAQQRSAGAIADIVLQNKNQVQYCYWVLKRRDSSLRGKVVLEFSIAPSGEVVRVRFRESSWGGNPLGKQVEQCIENVVRSWHFEPIAES
ncbi:MAG: AgmX/PglI C-terminal domain-containing protein, partial [bacterium]